MPILSQGLRIFRTLKHHPNLPMPMLRSLFYLFLLCCGSFYVRGQDELKSLKDFVLDDDELFFDHVVVQSDLAKNLKKEIKDGLVSPSDLIPKKIGVVSVYIYEEKFSSNRALQIYTLNPDGADCYFYNKIAGPAIAGLKKSFEDSDMELLLPEEYIEDLVGTDRYNVLAKRLSFSDPFSSAVKGAEASPSGKDFKFIYSMYREGYAEKVWDELADFAVDMGLDAVLTMEIVTTYVSKTTSLARINLMLHGVNKLEKEGKQGLLLNTYALHPDYMYPLVTYQKGEVAEESYAGMGRLLERIGADYQAYIPESINEAFGAR